MTSPFPKKIDLEFANVELHENFIISTINEGVLFDHAEKRVMFELFDTYYSDNAFVYIGIRKNDYTINPVCYINSYDPARLRGVAIVSNAVRSIEISSYEKQFFEGPFQIFSTLEEAKEWAQHMKQKQHAR
ncbi:MAG: hypothetical protein R3359_05360 [Marinirhabdus sp.]|nr:hypothetical protein [Marinirhabdus sp.]